MPWQIWRNKSLKNSGRVLHTLDLFEELQHRVADHSEEYGQGLSEIEKQLENIQSEFSQFVTLKFVR